MIQKNRSYILVPFPSRKVQGRVARRGGCIGRCSLLQQLLHDVCFPQAGRNVQRRLVILRHRGNNTGLLEKTAPHTGTQNICPRSVTFQHCRRALILLRSYLVNVAHWFSLCLIYNKDTLCFVSASQNIPDRDIIHRSL